MKSINKTSLIEEAALSGNISASLKLGLIISPPPLVSQVGFNSLVDDIVVDLKEKENVPDNDLIFFVIGWECPHRFITWLKQYDYWSAIASAPS